jgi:hypothetical protein
MLARARPCALLLAAAAASAADPVGPYLPWGVHIAYGEDPTTSMSVMWSTRSAVAGSLVEATSAATGKRVAFAGNASLFSDSGNSQWVHSARLTGLEAHAKYSYTVSDGQGNASAEFSFSLQPPPGGLWGGGRDYPVLTIYGDMGVATNAHKTLPWLYADALAGKMDVILHVGDIGELLSGPRAPRARSHPRALLTPLSHRPPLSAAYDLQSNNGASGDAFVVQVEPLAANLPYHLCPGNASTLRKPRQPRPPRAPRTSNPASEFEPSAARGLWRLYPVPSPL